MGHRNHEQEDKRRQKEYERIRLRQEAAADPAKRDAAIAALKNPISRGAVKMASRGALMDEVNRASTEDQISLLNSTAGESGGSASRVKKALMDKAPREMDKAIRKFQKEGKEISVETLTAEAKSTPSFVRMCESVGLNMEWFEDLARKRMEAFGL